jgi:hypothetical protein
MGDIVKRVNGLAVFHEGVKQAGLFQPERRQQRPIVVWLRSIEGV